ncbi:hypothetical protein VTN77DRAFT_4546 [Rasamsonia byssochlamydoides]|uniref:uncharacterized protein n=1 Tax=Rasamsonia byssochlamydoides TaxID=89139 RepID=UPI00374359B9
MALPTRALGRGGPQVPAIGVGLMNIADAYADGGSEEQRLEFLDRVYELGETFWDTADIYFDCEELVGKWFQRSGKRNDIFLATKFGLDYSTGAEVVHSDPEYAKAACERSLKRLGVDTIDLYYCHRVEREIPIEKTIAAMVELKNQGKIRYLGLSEVSGATLRRAHAVHPIAAVQVEYSPFSQDIEEPHSDLLATCRELGVAVVAYSPLGRGFLTRQIKSLDDLPDLFRKNVPRFTGENFPKILEVVKKLEAVGSRHGATASQVALAWLLAQDELVIPIPGTRSVKRVKENLDALKISLSEEEEKEIRDAVNQVNPTGKRTPEFFKGQLLGDTVLL